MRFTFNKRFTCLTTLDYKNITFIPKINTFTHFFYHQPIKVPTAGAQPLLHGLPTRKTGHNPPRIPLHPGRLMYGNSVMKLNTTLHTKHFRFHRPYWTQKE
jgi:hypothetical protein